MEQMDIGGIPAVLYGDKSSRVWLFVHGQGGNKEEAGAFAEIAVPAGYQVLGIDLPGHGARIGGAGFDPWTAVPELERVYEYIAGRWQSFSLRANSIGAYFSMLAFEDKGADKALFVSPIVDMKRLILDMMTWAGVTEEKLRREGEIATDFGQVLSWNYLEWVRRHPVSGWHTPTAILWAGGDNMTSRSTVTGFAEAHSAALTVYEPGEHWFHTPEQLAALKCWERENV